MREQFEEEDRLRGGEREGESDDEDTEDEDSEMDWPVEEDYLGGQVAEPIAADAGDQPPPRPDESAPGEQSDEKREDKIDGEDVGPEKCIS